VAGISANANARVNLDVDHYLNRQNKWPRPGTA
jgi:hypothetical protein